MTFWQNNDWYKTLCLGIYIPFQNVAASQSLFIFSKSSILAEKSQSLTRVKTLGPLKPLLVIYKIC